MHVIVHRHRHYGNSHFFLCTQSLVCAALAVDAVFALPAEIAEDDFLVIGGVEVVGVKVRALPSALGRIEGRCSVHIRGIEALVCGVGGQTAQPQLHIKPVKRTRCCVVEVENEQPDFEIKIAMKGLGVQLLDGCCIRNFMLPGQVRHTRLHLPRHGYVSGGNVGEKPIVRVGFGVTLSASMAEVSCENDHVSSLELLLDSFQVKGAVLQSHPDGNRHFSVFV